MIADHDHDHKVSVVKYVQVIPIFLLSSPPSNIHGYGSLLGCNAPSNFKGPWNQPLQVFNGGQPNLSTQRSPALDPLQGPLHFPPSVEDGVLVTLLCQVAYYI